MPKIERIDSQIVKELNEIIAYDFQDPRVHTLVSVTGAETSKDLKYAKVYVSVFNQAETAEVIKTLNGASGYLRSKLFERLKIRTMPNLTFYADASAAYGAKIEEVIKKINNKESD